MVFFIQKNQTAVLGAKGDKGDRGPIGQTGTSGIRGINNKYSYLLKQNELFKFQCELIQKHGNLVYHLKNVYLTILYDLY